MHLFPVQTTLKLKNDRLAPACCHLFIDPLTRRSFSGILSMQKNSPLLVSQQWGNCIFDHLFDHTRTSKHKKRSRLFAPKNNRIATKTHYKQYFLTQILLNCPLGSRDRAFESPHSDQTPLKSADFRGVLLIPCLLRRRG